MAVFVDTSALYAALSAGDHNHVLATETWTALAVQHERPVTSNYVLLETIALVACRLGPYAVRVFQTNFVPILSVHWIDETLHERAISALLTAGERHLSLVDCVSFASMRQLGLETAFAFDRHFADQGFRCIP